MTTPTRPAGQPRVRWGLYVLEGNRLRRPGLVGPAEELVLLASVTGPPARITVELYRGDRLRDRQEWAPAPAGGETVVAVHLGRSATLTGSGRLRCRLLLDGREIGERTVLLGPNAIDAQGRFAETPGAAASDATRLACVRLLEGMWRADEGDP
jgi:hypothetical protein